MHDIRPYLPELFTEPGSLLYIGARPDATSWLDELYEAGHQITVLEVWPENWQGLMGDKRIYDLVQGDVRQVDLLFDNNFAYIFWWHGPELAEIEIIYTLNMLERKADKLVAVACPYGKYPQSSHKGNPYETQQSTLYPDFFEHLRYEVATDGEADEVGSEVVAWKRL